MAPRLAESGAHSMEDLITLKFSMKEPSAQIQHATNDFCIAPCLAESGAHSMEDLITLNFSMKQPSAQVQHATNDFCIAPRVAESGAHSMDGLINPDFLMVAIFHGPKCITTGSKWAKNTCLSIQNGPGSLLEKRVFDPFLTHFWSQNGPFSRHFQIFRGPKHATTGSKRAKNTCLSIINGPGSFLEKCVFDPFWTHCWSQNGPFSRHFGIFHGPKRATTGSKRPKNTCLSIPSGLGTTLEKMIFFALGTLVDPPLAPTVTGLAGPPAAPSDQWYGGLRVPLGHSGAWKP